MKLATGEASIDAVNWESIAHSGGIGRRVGFRGLTTDTDGAGAAPNGPVFLQMPGPTDEEVADHVVALAQDLERALDRHLGTSTIATPSSPSSS